MEVSLHPNDLVELVDDYNLDGFVYEAGTELIYLGPGEEEGTSKLFDGDNRVVILPDTAFEKIEDV